VGQFITAIYIYTEQYARTLCSVQYTENLQSCNVLYIYLYDLLFYSASMIFSLSTDSA